MRNRLLANSATTPAKAFCRKVYPSKDPHEKAQCRSKQMRMQNFEVIHPQISSHLTNTISFEINWFIFFIDKVIVWVSEWVSHWVTLRNELTDVTLVSEDTFWRLYWCDSGSHSPHLCSLPACAPAQVSAHRPLPLPYHRRCRWRLLEKGDKLFLHFTFIWGSLIQFLFK